MKRSTQEWIENARKVHDNKYDYSKVDYKGSKEKVCIICPVHGEFWQEANSHLKGCKCPQCAYEDKCYNDINHFIKKSNEIHGDKYDYSLVKFAKKNDKIKIICPTHGEFITTPHIHLKGCECPKCVGNYTKDNEEFIKNATKKHKGKYDYSKIEYVNNRTKVCIVCPEHGEFWQEPSSHLCGKGCPVCGGTYHYNTKEWIDEARRVHGDKYDYSKVEYVNNKTKVCIICPEHGEFWQTPNSHLSGQGCHKCAYKTNGEKRRLKTDEFIAKSRKIHGNTFDYSKVEYIHNESNVCIICPEHGEYWQTPHDHLSGQGCPKCRESKLEKQIRVLLEENNINYIYQASKKDLEWLGYLSLDFYLPQHKIAIECQGEQHFVPVDFAGKGKEWAQQLFINGLKRDEIKKNEAEKHGIKIIYYGNFVKDGIINDKNDILKCITLKMI